jgi:hypothetical protein
MSPNEAKFDKKNEDSNVIYGSQVIISFGTLKINFILNGGWIQDDHQNSETGFLYFPV